MRAVRRATLLPSRLRRPGASAPARTAETNPRREPSDRRAGLRNWTLCVGSAAIAFLAGEIALGIAPVAAHRVLTPSDRGLTVSLDCYPSNPSGYFDLDLRDPVVRERLESLRVRRIEECAARAPHAVELRYNSLQFRDREPGPKRRGVRRVVVIGDSFTEGQGVKERDVYPRALERALNTGAGRWEVLNFGHRGADFPVLRETFERVLELDPDVVVYGMMLNDCEQSAEFRARHRRVSDHVTGRSRQSHPAGHRAFGLRTATFVRHRLERVRLHRDTTAWYNELYAEPNLEGWTRTQEHLNAMNRQMRLRGGHFLLATWPVLTGLEDDDYPFQEVHDTVGRFCHAAGIPWLDLLPALEGRHESELWVHSLDAHPNQLAHGLVGHRLAPTVRQLANNRS